MLVPQIRVVRCAPRSHPCPRCGRLGQRKRPLHRRIRSLAYRQVAYLDVHYAEYRASCACCKFFRSWPLEVPAKADYDGLVRAAVLERILDDGLNIERTRAALKRDFFLNVSEGFVYDCLRWKVAQLDFAQHRQLVLRQFSGTLCVDELHLGRFTLLLATDPGADLPVAAALVRRNDAEHMRRFLRNLANGGLQPSVVVSDGSNLYPGVLAEVWPGARHQLCVFHVLKDLNDLILQGVRRLARALARRGNRGRKRRRGRHKAGQAAGAAGPTLKEKASFVLKHRFLIVKNTRDFDKDLWDSLVQMFVYLPELRTLWRFACAVRTLFEPAARVQTLWQRRAKLLRDEDYQRVPELLQALALLEPEKFRKMVAFTSSAAGSRTRTNNHVERTNRRLRFWEKVRYKWRRRKWVVRFVLLALDRWWQQAAQAEAETQENARTEQGSQSPPSRAAG
jgi:Transposase